MRLKEYYINLASKLVNPETAPKAYWKLVKSVYGNRQNSGIPPIIHNNNTITDDLEKANQIVLHSGDNFHVYRGLRHQMIALEDTELFEFSTQHFESDSYRLKKGN